MALFTPYLVFAFGGLVAQNQEVGIDMPKTGEDVETITGGREGPAIGPDATIITITNAIPKGGAKVDWAEFKEKRAEVKIRVIQIGSKKKLQGRFIVDSYNTNGATGQACRESITMTSIGIPAPRFK